MPSKSPNGGDVFIVDNGDSDWKVRQYLREWADIASKIDIATGYFEIGALLALDGQWQKLDELRILMGDEVSKRTKQAMLAGVRAALDQLDTSIEEEKKSNDFLTGIDGIVEGLSGKSPKIRCRVYNKEKFHAKAYINHARSAVIGSAALVGSSNFTFPGLSDNVELNVQIKGREVQLLQEWYEHYWNKAEDITAEVLRVVERHTREYTPFEIYAKALHEYFRGERLEPDAWEARQSIVYKVLDQYQKDGYHNLIDIAKVYNGAFLCDGVGLGKTFIGLMLIERFAVQENKNVLLLVPKSGRDTVWGPEISRYLGHVNGIFGNRLVVMTHTDLTAQSAEMTARIEAAKRETHVVIIDEAHNFRNIGTRGEFTGDIPDSGPARGGKLIEGEGIVRPSRYRRLFDLLGDKPVYMLTATPVNNDLADLRHLIELFSRRQDDYFANKPLAVKNLRSYFNELKKKLEKVTHGAAVTDAEEAKTVLAADGLVSALVVQRSRGYVKEHQRIHGGRSVLFPKREDPRVAEYSLKGVYGKLLDLFGEAFHHKDPLFSLPMYQPINYLKVAINEKDETAIFAKGRQTQIVALIRTGFLKRLESSVVAFRLSCHRLLIKLLAFVVTNVETAPDKKRFEVWKRTHKALVAELQESHPELFTAGKEAVLFANDPEDDEDGLLSESALDGVTKLDRAVYKVDEMVDESMNDLDVVAQILDELRTFKPKQDVKLQALIKLLTTDPVLKEHKIMLFTEFADTAEYLREQLIAAGIKGIDAVDGSAAARDRVGVVKRFAPYYNRSNSAQAAAAGGEIRVLISTDVLSEGLNLQDATRLINYEIHWNPVRLMQRIGRIDRRLNPEIESAILADHPDQKPLRGTACYWNFLPPEELRAILNLYNSVTKKTLNISKTFGIEGKKLIHPDDDYDALKDFNAAYEQKSKTEDLALEYERLLKDHPGLDKKLDNLPGRVFSGKAHPKPDTRAVFFCYQLPTRLVNRLPADAGQLTLLDAAAPAAPASSAPPPITNNDWSIDVGPVRWYLFDLAAGTIVERDAPSVADLIRSAPDEPRKVSGDRPTLAQARVSVEKHIKDTYLRQTQAPGDAPKPVLRCWMELC